VTQRLRLSEENRRWWTLAAMCFALFMVMLDNTVTNVALPSIQRSFDASLSALEWTINAYTLSFAVLLVTGGRLGDIFGRRRVFLIGVVVFAAASATIGFAPTEGWLVASRAVQGVGAALMMPGTLSIITNAFPPQERGKAIGTWAGVSAIALALGPLVGGWLTEDVTWRAIFFINVPVAAVAVAVTLFATHESRDETASRRVDFPGIVTLTLGLTALVLALVDGNGWGWGSPRIVALLIVAVVGLVSFAVIEKRSAAPIVDFAFFRSRQFLGANVVAFSISFGMFAVFFFLALYMQNILGYSPLETGVRFLPTTVVVMVAGPIAGRLADRVGPRTPLVVGLLMVSASLAWQSRIQVDTSFVYLVPAFAVLGIGMGFTMSPMSTAAMNAVDRTKAGVASGTLSMTRMVGGTFGVAALGALVAAVGRHDLSQSLPNMPAASRDRLVDALGSGGNADGTTAGVRAATHQAFVDALGTGLTISAVVLLLAALAAWLMISPGRPASEQPVEVVPDAAVAGLEPEIAGVGGA
jgi:EmrB/QacA subfamily drug resistance transporter